jgi:hypothetical protein
MRGQKRSEAKWYNYNAWPRPKMSMVHPGRKGERDGDGEGEEERGREGEREKNREMNILIPIEHLVLPVA